MIDSTWQHVKATPQSPQTPHISSITVMSVQISLSTLVTLQSNHRPQHISCGVRVTTVGVEGSFCETQAAKLGNYCPYCERISGCRSLHTIISDHIYIYICIYVMTGATSNWPLNFVLLDITLYCVNVHILQALL